MVVSRYVQQGRPDCNLQAICSGQQITTSTRISTSSPASQPQPYQRDGVRKIRQRSQKGKLKNQCFQQFRVLNCAQTPLIIHGCNQHQQTVILIPIKGGFANILFLTFLTVASILWRPAPWYGWVLEAGDDENGLLQVPGHAYFMPPSNSKKCFHLAPSNKHLKRQNVIQLHHSSDLNSNKAITECLTDKTRHVTAARCVYNLNHGRGVELEMKIREDFTFIENLRIYNKTLF